MKINRRTLLRSFLLAFSFSVSGQVFAQDAPDWIDSARHYAREAGVPENEAIRRIRLQAAISDLQATLQAQEAASFAGIFIDESPTSYGFVALFTDDPAGKLARHNTDSRLAGVGRAALAARLGNRYGRKNGVSPRFTLPQA